ncbi:hypothetical protein N898_02305 [Salmonella enterica subsp. arizonae serovar 62:z36:- str. RKS2983]|nr:hypothetical protein N898_02305 [Salmonella enterica subsp. arizonae serovar 62:z36:- str. RKS2983]
MSPCKLWLSLITIHDGTNATVSACLGVSDFNSTSNDVYMRDLIALSIAW